MPMAALAVLVPAVSRWELPAQSSVKQEPFKAPPARFPPLCWKKGPAHGSGALSPCGAAPHDSPEVEVKPAFPWGTSPEPALKFVTFPQMQNS